MNIKEYENEIRKNGGEQTVEHIEGVAELMAQAAPVFGEDKEIYRLVGRLHDAGKIVISPETIGSTKKLTPEQKREIRKHPVYGRNIIKQLKGIPEEARQMAMDAAAYHHAWYNGMRITIDSQEMGGYYPDMEYDRISGSAIPKVARIMAVIDVVNAIMQKRSYDGERTLEEALSIIDDLTDKGQFDPLIVKTIVTKVFCKEYRASKRAAI